MSSKDEEESDSIETRRSNIDSTSGSMAPDVGEAGPIVQLPTDRRPLPTTPTVSFSEESYESLFLRLENECSAQHKVLTPIFIEKLDFTKEMKEQVFVCSSWLSERHRCEIHVASTAEVVRISLTLARAGIDFLIL